MWDKLAVGAAGGSVGFIVDGELDPDAVALSILQLREGHRRQCAYMCILQGATNIRPTSCYFHILIFNRFIFRLLVWVPHLQRRPLQPVVHPVSGVVCVLLDQAVVPAQVNGQRAGLSAQFDLRAARVSWRGGAKSRKQSCDHKGSQETVKRGRRAVYTTVVVFTQPLAVC